MCRTNCMDLTDKCYFNFIREFENTVLNQTCDETDRKISMLIN